MRKWKVVDKAYFVDFKPHKSAGRNIFDRIRSNN